MSFSPDSNTSVQVKIEQLLYGGGRSVNAIKQAKKGESLSLSAIEDARELVVIETARNFYSVLRLRKERLR